jgi:hypothetical protein
MTMSDLTALVVKVKKWDDEAAIYIGHPSVWDEDYEFTETAGVIERAAEHVTRMLAHLALRVKDHDLSVDISLDDLDATHLSSCCLRIEDVNASGLDTWTALVANWLREMRDPTFRKDARAARVRAAAEEIERQRVAALERHQAAERIEHEERVQAEKDRLAREEAQRQWEAERPEREARQREEREARQQALRVQVVAEFTRTWTNRDILPIALIEQCCELSQVEAEKLLHEWLTRRRLERQMEVPTPQAPLGDNVSWLVKKIKAYQAAHPPKPKTSGDEHQ